jgi:signal transduction histidine kinase
MTLVNRVSAFFLAVLTVVLVGYSATLYWILQQQLRRQFDERLYGAFRILVAAVEVEEDDVKFEPSDHTIALGADHEADDVRWAIYDERGRLVDRSRNLTPDDASDVELLSYAAQLRSAESASQDVGAWRLVQKRLAAATPKSEASREAKEHEALIVTAARLPGDMEATLRLVGGLVVVLPIGVGIAAAVIGRTICRRALQPVGDMARRARMMAQGRADRRLPVVASRDELAELGDAFNAVLDRLFESLERQRRFAGEAAHQLRTPLAAVLGQLDVALRRPRSVDEYRETLTVVREQANDLRQIMESLLFLARLQNESAPPETERLVLATWLTDYLPQWSFHPRFHDLRIIVDSSVDNDDSIVTSHVLLKQLLDNLVGNALKYSDAGTPIEITVRRYHGEIEFAVGDRGIGIAPEDVDAVFQPFFRSLPARRSGIAGTGLGLAVANQIAAALGGKLDCRSRLGEGSRFALTLPSQPSGSNQLEVDPRIRSQPCSFENTTKNLTH